ncbi:MAG: PilT/PilU family type 4a pilus ATPase [Peptococcaceae bacterium]|nr:PilT/PilU family type 4a pilus ATPase [Peptococcaceae bacterium]
MTINEILGKAVEQGASDIFIISRHTLTFKVQGKLVPASDAPIPPEEVGGLINQIYRAKERDMALLFNTGDDDFSFSVGGLGRFRVNAFRQRGTLAAVVRVISFTLPNPTALNIPETVTNLANFSSGLVLITGPAGSGKSTTLACIIDRINQEKSGHIITMEDPIEFIHRHKRCIVTQREVPADSRSYVTALRAALRQSPNVLLLGEMRDLETIEIAMTAAETGQLVFSTLHTMGAANTIDRIIDVFPHSQQQQIRIQLSMVLKAVVSQQLLSTTRGRLLPAFEIMLSNLAVQNMIREEKIHQIESAIYAGTNAGMTSMDNSLFKLYEQSLITEQDAILHSNNYDSMRHRISLYQHHQ